MTKFINRATLQTKESGSQTDHLVEDWIHFPDMSSVEGVDIKYCKIDGDNVVEMTAEEKAAVDADEEETKWVSKRVTRDTKLSTCDWTQLQDVPLTSEKVTEWATYRRALRDVPEAYTNVDDVMWPSRPE